MKKMISILSSLALVLTFGACSSTKITSSWKANDAVNVNSQKVLVLGILNGRNRPIKMNMEEELAEKLRSAGINAEPSSAVFSPKAFTNMSEDRALRVLRNKGYDAVITIVLLDKSTDRSYTPGTVGYQPYGVYYNRFWGYYRTVYGRVYTPGYYTTSTNYYWESNLYTLKDSKLLYSVQSESFDPSSNQQLSEDYASKVVKDMTKQGLLAKK
jgi:hypothetical protein